MDRPKKKYGSTRTSLTVNSSVNSKLNQLAWEPNLDIFFQLCCLKLQNWIHSPTMLETQAVFRVCAIVRETGDIPWSCILINNEAFRRHLAQTTDAQIENSLQCMAKIQSQSQSFWYGRSIFCLPHRPHFWDIFDSCLHWVSVIRAT